MISCLSTISLIAKLGLVTLCLVDNHINHILGQTSKKCWFIIENEYFMLILHEAFLTNIIVYKRKFRIHKQEHDQIISG